MNKKTQKILGFSLIASPFVAIAITALSVIGIKATLTLFGFVATLLSVIWVGLSLIESGSEDEPKKDLDTPFHAKIEDK